MHRALRILARALLAVCMGVVALLGAIWLAGNTAAGRGWIADLTHRLSGGTVKLTGLAGSFPESLTLDSLELEDDAGVWLTADHIAARWSPLALLSRRIVVGELEAARVHMERLPKGRSNAARSRGKGMPHIEVHQFSIGRVELGASLAGTPVAVSARGNLQLRSLDEARGDLEAHRIDGQGDYSLHLRADARRVDASLTVHEPASGPLQNLLALPGLGALSATLTLAGPRDALQADTTVDAGQLHGLAHGTIDLAHAAADLDYSLSAAAMAPRPDFSWGRLHLQGKWRGSLSAPTAEGRLEVDELTLAGASRIARLTMQLAAARGTLSAALVADGLEIPGPQPRLLAGDPVKVDASLKLDQAHRPLELTASHPLFKLHAVAETAAAPPGTLHAIVELRLPDIAPIAAYASQDARGDALIRAQLTHGPGADTLGLEAYLGLDGGAAPWIGLLGPRANLKLSGSYSGSAVKIQDLRLVGNAAVFNANGMATLDRSRPAGLPIKDLQARWQLQVADLSRFSGDVAGDLKMSGQLSGPPRSMSASADVVSRLSARGSEMGTLEASVRLRGVPEAPGGTIQAHGVFDGAPLALDAALDRGADRTYRLVVHQGQWKSARADGDITTDRELTQSRGQLHLDIGELGDFKKLLRTDIAGSLHGSLGFAPADGHTEAKFRVEGENLAIGQIAGNVQLQGSGVSEALNLQLSAQLPNFYGKPAGVSANGRLDLDAHQLSLATISANYRGQNFRLIHPAVLSFGQGMSIQDVRIGAQSAEFRLAGQIAPSLDLRASLRHVDASLFNVFTPGLLADGLLEAQARLAGSPSSPTGSMTLEVRDVRFADETATGLPALAIHAQAQLAGGSATLEGKLTGGPSSQLTVTGSVPLGANGTLDLAIGGKLDAGLVNPLLEARGMRAAGELTVNATVRGNPAAPQVGGGITLAGGSLRDYGRGLNLSQIGAEIVGMEGGLQIRTFTAKAGSGTVTMTGTLGVLRRGMPVDLKLAAKNAQPIASNIVTANLDADLHVSGSATKRLDVAGTIHLNRANIGIPDSLPPEVAVLDVRRRGQSAPAPPGGKLTLGVDVLIQAPQQILVQGRGLDAELGGEIRLSGISEDLLASGGFDLHRGSFTIAGNKLSFTQGRVGFDGAGLRKKIDPTLDFTAESNVGDVTVTLRITGVADAPRFDFTSNPALPQDEIMARLFFGESAAQLSALQVAQIGAALATLSGVGGGASNPLVKLQKSLGLDRLTVAANPTTTATGAVESSGAAIQAGRYVSKRVYVEAKQSTTGTSQLQVDVDLTQHLKLQTRLGNGTAAVQGTTPENDPGSAVGLSYQFEY